MNELIGRQIDNYRIDALLGEGGMGAVYRAFDLNLARPVALKVMHAQLARRAEFQQRFLQEARAAARLNDHLSVVKIHHFGESQGLLYMVMALIPGGSLSAHIQRLQKTGEVVQLRETLALLAQVADALGYAHRHHVVHRDIKPGNVLIQRLEEPDREGDPPLRAVVTDFGLAKLLEGGLETQSGGLMGTLAFMSPEQCLHKELDGRSDIYSLGVMVYLLTTGHLPFNIESPTDAVMKHLNEIPPAPRLVYPGLPATVEVIIQKAIAKKPEDRFQKAETVALALREAAKRLTEGEVTQFAGQRTVLSLATHLQSQPAAPEPSQMGFDLSPLPSKDQLVIAQKDHTPHAIPLNKNQLTLGRTGENDIPLDHADVSRQHARLERTSNGWHVVDLKSTNGTFLDNVPLLPGIPEVFTAGKTLRIGPFFIHLRGAASPVILGTTYAPGLSRTVPEGATHLQSTTGQVAVTLKPAQAEIAPGNYGHFQVELFNQGLVPDHFKMRLEGLPAAWVTIPQGRTQLMPGISTTLAFSIRPPQESGAKAGNYPYQLVVESETRSGESVMISGQIVVQPFERFSVDIHPSKLSNGGTSRVSIRNEGNLEGIYSLVGRDPANEIQFAGEHGRIRIPNGETATQQVSVQTRKRPFLGSTKTFPFEVQVKAASGTQKGIAGQVEVQPMIPLWILPLVGILATACLLIGGFGYNAWNQSNVRGTQTAEARIAVAEAATNAGNLNLTQQAQATGTAVAAATQTAVLESTSVALTAIAQGDDDGDGLSNQKELEIGTDPKNEDTDGDGLIDGEEVNQFGTDPKKNDTDGDNLLDGQEVNDYGSSPTNPDSDGDGVLDGVEVVGGTDPNQLPTATPIPTVTPIPTPIPSATKTPLPTHTPVPPSVTPDIPIVLYDLVTNADGAHWTSGAGELPWGGALNDERGFATWHTNVSLENGAIAALALATHPEWVTDGLISGTFTDIYWSGYVVQAGDRFISTVGFLSGGGAGDVRFRVMLRPEGGTNTWVADVYDTYDGVLQSIDIPLDAWAGLRVDFILQVEANGTSAQDWAVWVDTRIER